MGGEVLELWADRVERVEREAREAREQGLEQGLEQGINELSQKLLELGVSEELIAQAVAQVRGEEKAIL
jgi:predicted transposase YdaD